VHERELEQQIHVEVQQGGSRTIESVSLSQKHVLHERVVFVDLLSIMLVRVLDVRFQLR
jgi:hypothetical protein